MSEVAKKEVPGTRRLVLGYDGGCLSCSMLAQKVSQRVGDKLEVKNLRGSQVREWRKQALEGNAPWVPILFEVDGERVRVYQFWCVMYYVRMGEGKERTPCAGP